MSRKKLPDLTELPVPLILTAFFSAPHEQTVGDLRLQLFKMAEAREEPAFRKGTWYPIETAPERPEGDYLAKDCLGYVHKTNHPRGTLMHAGWADAWSPVEDWTPCAVVRKKFDEDVKEIIASHAREFKRLLKDHNRDGEVIEGVGLIDA